MKLLVGVAVLVVGGVVLKDIATPGPPQPCVFSCALPPSGVPEYAGISFASNAYGFAFTYPSGPLSGFAKSEPPTGAGVADLQYEDGSGNFLGLVLVAAGKGRVSPSSLVSNEANELSSDFQNLQGTGPMLGAEIGFQPGDGQFYSGIYSAPDGDTYNIDLGIVAVQHGNVWTYLVGISTIDAGSHTASLYPDFDEILDRWRWSA
jgi:hypothetical protein